MKGGLLMFCLKCSKSIGTKRVCPFCGYDQLSIGGHSNKRRKRQKFSFSDEERLGLGLYPQTEEYKMALISKILCKK